MDVDAEGTRPARGLRRRAAVLASAVVLCAAFAGVDSAAADVDASLTRYPYLTDSVQDSITVNWATPAPPPDPPGTTTTVAGNVRYGPPGSCTEKSKGATKTGITVNGVAEYQWKASLPVGASTPYCYRVFLTTTVTTTGGPVTTTTDLLGSDPSPAFTSQVATGSTAPFSFAVFGDWGQAYAGSANPDQANVLRQISVSGARFAVMTGDTAYPDGSQTNYGDLRQTGEDISGVFGPSFWGVPGRSIPVFNVTGNHGLSAGGNTQILNWPEAEAVANSNGRYAMDDYPAMPDLGTSAGRYASLWYAFDAGPARFYVLTAAWGDKNGGPTGDVYGADAAAHWAPGKAEYDWLKNDLEAHPNGLKFAFWHYPLHADTVGARSDTALQGGPGTLQGLLNANNVNIAFNGHAHGYERNTADPAGLVSYVLGNGGAHLGPVGPCDDVFDAYAIGEQGSQCGLGPAGLSDDHVFGFAKVTVNGQQVTVTPTDELGRTYDVQTYTFPSSEPDQQPPTQPPGLRATGSAADRVDLSWSASTDNVGVTGYRVFRDGSRTPLATLTGTQTTYADRLVAPGARYTYRVAALDAAGNQSALTPPASATTPGAPDTRAPTAPGIPTATVASSSQVELSWTPSADDVGVAGYKVYLDGVLLGTAPAGATSYDDATATPATTCAYAVSAVDAAGNESTRSAVSGCAQPGAGGTPMPAPPAPLPSPPADPGAAPVVPPAPRGACAVHVRGRTRADHLRGARSGDRLDGLAGDDLLEGFGGADCLYGGSGRDVLRGGTGNDRLWSGSGADRLTGGTGSDRLWGSTGDDRLWGSSGADRLWGDSGNDRLSGGTGNDRLSGGSSADRVTGGTGRDRLFGGSGRDTVDARDGWRDVVDCGTGRDTARVDARDRVRRCERVSVRAP